MEISIKSLGLSYRSHKLYNVTFFDHTVTTLVTANASIVDTWISDMEHLHEHRLPHLVVGLDCKWTHESCRVPGSNRIETLQLCIRKDCLIFQLIHANKIPQFLKMFLTNKNYTFVGVGVGEYARKLYNHYGLEVANTVDLRDLAADFYGNLGLRYYTGLKELALKVLDKDMEEPNWVLKTDWAVDSLSSAQIQYACVDASTSYEIGRVLNASDYRYYSKFK